MLTLIALAGAWGCATTGRPRSVPRQSVIHGQVAAPAGDKGLLGPAGLSEAIVYVDRIPDGSAPEPAGPRPGNASSKQKSRGVPSAGVPPAHAKGGSARHEASSNDETSAPSPEIAARGDAFSPRVLVVVAGTRVTFRNADRVYHSTFSVSRARKFDIGTYAPGQRRTVLFDRPGVVDLFCGLHPKTSGFIVVVPNPFYTRANTGGAFSLAPLPPGRYAVRIWHPRYGERKTTVDLTAGVDTDLLVKF